MLWHFVIIIFLTITICGIAAYIEFHRAKAHNQTDITFRSILADSEKYETTVELTLDTIGSEVMQSNIKDANEIEIVMEQDITFIHTNESIRSSDRKNS